MILTTQIFTLLRKKETYQNVKPYIRRLSNKDQTVYKPICHAIILGLSTKEHVTNLFAARLGMDTVEKKNTDFNQMFSELCLPYFEKIAEFRKEDQDENRGKYYYSQTPNKEEISYGNSLLKITLECLEAWAKLYPCQSDQLTQSAFFKTYTRLLEKKVKFPDQYYYIKKEMVDNNTSPMLTKILSIYSEIQRKNIQLPNAQTSEIVQQDQQQKQTQANQQGEMQKPKSISSLEKKNQEIKYWEAQSLMNEFSQLKEQLNEKQNCKEEESQDFIDFVLLNQNINQLMGKIETKIEEFLNQDDVNTSLELLKVYDEIKILSEYYQKLEKDKIFELLQQQQSLQQQSKQEDSDSFSNTNQATNEQLNEEELKEQNRQKLFDFIMLLQHTVEQRVTLQQQKEKLKRLQIIEKGLQQQILNIQKQSDSVSSSSEDPEIHNSQSSDQEPDKRSESEQQETLDQSDKLEMEKMRQEISELKVENENMKQEIESQINNQIQQQEEKID
ncbi:unnamed protein product [Paramecium octaurelia]|uniref:Uncharacterized protein n=1 Tax=Paramecium octaurelia TaxID=43137 RepID=A0A8S1W1R6_PAROT|nr:unnamed protein product [Paramecium octaurelia]